jgi:thiol-disulfide isomerase/thioredoxin
MIPDEAFMHLPAPTHLGARRLGALALALTLASCATTSSGAGGPTEGAPFSPFREKDLDGKTFDLAPSVGRDVILVSFWATWCTPCKGEMPHLQAFHEAYAKDGLVIVSIALDGPDTAAEVAPYIRKQGYTFPVLVDQHGDLAQTLNPTSSAPFAILVGRDGRVVRRFEGFQPSEAKALEAELRSLLGLPPEPTP